MSLERAEPHVAVVLASAGRSELLGEVIEDLARQTVDFTLVVSVPDDESLPSGGLPPGATVAYDRGLAAQRNAGLELVGDAEYVFFFDDDAVVRADYLERALALFEAEPQVVAMTGRVLLDGAATEAIPREQALAALARSASEPLAGQWVPTRELYGCNFAYRRSAARGERFDPRLPLYSWLEDHDFARRMMRHGVLARHTDSVIVHRGVKSGGRTAHKRLGYSQMMNPIYLHSVRSFPLWLAIHEIIPRCGKNLVLSFVGAEKEWRRERLSGNLVALLDAIRGRRTPERMLEF